MAGPCDSVNRLLSPYVDDALAGADRAVVEGHLRDCKDCQGRRADLQATRATLGAYFSAQADRVDFSGFSQRVMAQIRKEPLPFGQRVRLWWTELMAYHSAAISTKMLQELGGSTVIGPLLVGFDKPVQIVPLAAKDSDIVNMAALAAFNLGG